MTQQDHAEDTARRILFYLDVDHDKKRVEKIAKFISEHRDKYAKVQEKITVKKHVVYQKVYRNVYVTPSKQTYDPKDYIDHTQILDDAANYVCDKHQITLQQLRRNSPAEAYRVDITGLGRDLSKRSQLLVDARQEFVHITKMNYYNELTLREIGLYLGYKDHTAIWHLFHKRMSRKFQVFDMEEMQEAI